MKNKILLLTMATLLISTLSACQATDVIANYGIKSFEQIVTTAPENVVEEDIGYTIYSPNKTESFTFGEKLYLEFDVTPFTSAGLETSKLNGEFSIKGDKLIVASDGKGVNETDVNVAFEKLIRDNRDRLEYHTDHDIYELMLGNGNAFRWAKDITTNERDVVFVLNPAPFIDAGLDPASLDGWRFAKVKLMENGKTVEVDRLLRVYNIN